MVESQYSMTQELISVGHAAVPLSRKLADVVVVAMYWSVEMAQSQKSNANFFFLWWNLFTLVDVNKFSAIGERTSMVQRQSPLYDATLKLSCCGPMPIINAIQCNATYLEFYGVRNVTVSQFARYQNWTVQKLAEYLCE